MKRDYKETSSFTSNNNNISTTTTTTTTSSGSCYKAEAASSSSSVKGKLWEDGSCCGGGMDELLAVLGYKVRSSDMAEVAQKLEQLEMAMLGGGGGGGESEIINSDTVHYNPSDLSGWVQSMLSELACCSTERNKGSIFNDDSDIRSIPGYAAYPPQPSGEVEVEIGNSNGGGMVSRKRAKTWVQTAGVDSSSRPVILIDSQETGVRLVHTLLACAEAVQQGDLDLADALVKHTGLLAASQPGAMRKVATYFAEALARRIYKIYPQDGLDPSYTDTLEMHFYETCPYLKFAHFTANQAILEAFSTADRVHVVDFGLKQGMQWPALLQALALRPGGPPAFRLTGIGPPHPADTDTLQQVGWKLAQLAETIGVEFQFRGIVANTLADIQPDVIQISPGEAVAVNSVFELHRLLGCSGGIEKVLNLIKAMKPKIFTLVEQEANHNGPVFLDRFTEALHYYSSLFDSVEGSTGLATPNQDQYMSELYLGRQICNVVACEGPDRVERHETLAQWRGRMESAGFDPVHLGSNAFKQASMLLALFAGGDGYRVEENNGSLMLGWHTRPLIATSAWQLSTPAAE